MHYSQAYRVQEVPRLGRPNGVEPFRQAGAETVLEAPRSYHLLSLQELKTMMNPLPRTEATLAQATAQFAADPRLFVSFVYFAIHENHERN